MSGSEEQQAAPPAEHARAALQLAREASDEVGALQDRVAELEAAVDERDATIQRLENELSQLRQEFTDDGGPRWRIGSYLATLRRQAAGGKRDTSELTIAEGRAAVNSRVSRSQVYKDFERVDGLVKEGKLPATIAFRREDKGAEKPSRLRLSSLDESLPREFGGVRLTREGDV